MTASISTSQGCGEELREQDVERHIDNRYRYGELYDALSDESPAYLGQELSKEIRFELKKGGNN